MTHTSPTGDRPTPLRPGPPPEPLVLEPDDEPGQAPGPDDSADVRASFGRRLRRARARVTGLVDAVRLTNWRTTPVERRRRLYALRLVMLLAQRFVSEQLLVRASSLAFFTVLSLVPLLVVGVTVLAAFGGDDGSGGSQTLLQLQEMLMPALGEDVSRYAVDAIERATEGGLGGVGVLTLIFTAVMLFFHIERVFNDTWHVTERRPVYVRLLLFYSLITLGPVLLSVSLYHAAGFSRAINVGFLTRLTWSMVPFVVNAVIFLIVFKLVPNTQVRWRHAIVAAVVTSVVFEIAKVAFAMYAEESAQQQANMIYGPLVMLPMFLMWVYVSWILVLIGNQVAYCMQHMDSLTIFDGHARGQLHVEAFVGSSLVALEVYSPIARAWLEQEGPMTIDRICREVSQHQRIVAEVLGRLEEAGLIIEACIRDQVGYLPARPLEDISLLEILAPFELDLDEPNLPADVRELLANTREARNAPLADLNACALAPAPPVA